MLIAAKPAPIPMLGAGSSSRPQATRKFKVKTGCITCRIRKVKCDEAKPFCNRCTGTGRKCDGYRKPEDKKDKAQQAAKQHPQQRKQTSLAVGQTKSASVPPPSSHIRHNSASCTSQKSLLPSPHSRHHSTSSIPQVPSIDLLADATFISSKLSANERRWLQYFCERTAPAISGVFDNGFWTQALPQIGNTEPAVRHAMLAVGSLHSRFETGCGSVNDVEQRPGVPGHDFTIEQYNRAIACLSKYLASDNKTVEVPLVCCLLFICLECLYGNRTLALGHLQNGVKILNSARITDGELVSNADAATIKHKLYHNFLRLDAHSTLFGKPVPPAFEIFELLGSTLASVIPSSLASFDDAKRSLDTLIACTLGFVKSAKTSVHSGIHTPSTYTYQSQLQEQYEAWLVVFEGLLGRRNSLTGLTLRTDPREFSLRMLHAASWVWLSTCLSDIETVYDEYTSDFANIINWAQELCKSSSTPRRSSTDSNDANPSTTQTIFTMDMSIMPSLFLTATKCRDPLLRRKAIAVLDSYQGCEGLWDATLYAAVGRRVVEIEEAGLMLYADMEGKLMPNVLPDDRCRIRNTDVEETSMDEVHRARKVRFHTRPNGPRAAKCVWNEMVEF